MAEIVPAEPIEERYFERGETSSAASTSYASSYEIPHVSLAITGAEDDYIPKPFDSEKIPPTFASEIQRFLRVANLIGSEEPRVAYLCKFFVHVVGFVFSS